MGILNLVGIREGEVVGKNKIECGTCFWIPEEGIQLIRQQDGRTSSLKNAMEHGIV